MVYSSRGLSCKCSCWPPILVVLRSLPKSNKRSLSSLPSLSVCVSRGESVVGSSFPFLPQIPRLYTWNSTGLRGTPSREQAPAGEAKRLDPEVQQVARKGVDAARRGENATPPAAAERTTPTQPAVELPSTAARSSPTGISAAARGPSPRVSSTPGNQSPRALSDAPASSAKPESVLDQLVTLHPLEEMDF